MWLWRRGRRPRAGRQEAALGGIGYHQSGIKSRRGPGLLAPKHRSSGGDHDRIAGPFGKGGIALGAAFSVGVAGPSLAAVTLAGVVRDGGRAVRVHCAVMSQMKSLPIVMMFDPTT